MRLVINAQNCIHCKTCDIKDYRYKTLGSGGENDIISENSRKTLVFNNVMLISAKI